MADIQLPCKICQDPSTGMHYGVFSCDACKGFFNRHSKSKMRDKPCTRSGRCNIQGRRKNICAPCRYQICLEAGMSKKAIKTGRYTLQWKDSLNTEMQQLEASRLAELEARLQPSVPLGPNGETMKEIISTILSAYECLPSNLRSSQEYLDRQTRQYWEQYHLKQRLFGKLPTVSTEEFTEIFSITGIDVDDRFQFSEKYLSSVRGWFYKLVQFSKMIPGFKQLPLEDQYNLLKYNRFEFWFFGAYRGFNPMLETAISPNGFCYHKDETRKTFPPDVSDTLFDVARCLRRLNLTQEEHVITQTISLFFPDRAPLSNKAAVESMQMTLLTCLEFLISKRPPRDRVRALGNAINMLTTVRRLSYVDERKAAEEEWIDHLQSTKEKYLKEELEYGAKLL